MSGESWVEISDESDAWVSIVDSQNGYVEALYVLPRYILGTSGVTWDEQADTSTTWSPV